MLILLNVSLAKKIGITDAVVTQYLWDEITEGDDATIPETSDRAWFRASRPMLAVKLPFLTEHRIEGSLKRLLTLHIIKSAELNPSPFDHTLSYTFTDLGRELMRTTESDGDGGWL